MAFARARSRANGEFNPGVGGPFKKDSLWFFLSGRYQEANSYVPNIFHDKNANDPTKFAYDPDFTRPGVIERDWHVYQGRLTWQATPKNKFGITYDQENFCICSDRVSSTVAPEAATEFNFPLQRFVQVDWNMPVSSNLLIEAERHSPRRALGRHGTATRRGRASERSIRDVISAQDMFVTGLTWRAPHTQFGGPSYNNSWNVNLHYRAAASYITGFTCREVRLQQRLGAP